MSGIGNGACHGGCDLVLVAIHLSGWHNTGVSLTRGMTMKRRCIQGGGMKASLNIDTKGKEFWPVVDSQVNMPGGLGSNLYGAWLDILKIGPDNI